LKIIQVVHAFPPDIGGVESHVYSLSKELAKKGHDVTVVTTRPAGSLPRETIDGVKIIRHRYIALPMFSSVRVVPLLCIRLAMMDADIFHAHSYGAVQPLQASLAAFFSRRPFIFTLHGYPRLKGIGGLFKWAYSQVPARIFLSIARKIITVTDATKEDIEKEAGSQKIATIPNGVDFALFKPEPELSSLKTNDIGYVGRFDPYKGIDTLIRAFALVKKKVPSAKLRIIGKDEGQRAMLEFIAKENGVEVSFEQAEAGKMPEIYGSLSAVVLPSKYEGMSIVLLEAIASGRPMLSTPVGASPALFEEVYKKNSRKFIFPVGGHIALSEKLIEVLSDKLGFEKVCAQAREEMKKTYSWSAAAEKTIGVYKELLG
jgi:1,2-diacylglycerol 3-alpha-glucosyltransferase